MAMTGAFQEHYRIESFQPVFLSWLRALKNGITSVENRTP
jgi:hypothetical protein